MHEKSLFREQHAALKAIKYCTNIIVTSLLGSREWSLCHCCVSVEGCETDECESSVAVWVLLSGYM